MRPWPEASGPPELPRVFEPGLEPETPSRCGSSDPAPALHACPVCFGPDGQRLPPLALMSPLHLSPPGGYSSQSNYSSPGSGQSYSGAPTSYPAAQGGYGRNADHSMNYQYR